MTKMKCFINYNDFSLITKNKCFFVLLVLLNFCFVGAQEEQVHDFCSSFINSYDMSGRYTHEYHPFILDRAKESFLKLQDYLQNKGYEINGHEIILGYQEDAIVPYQTQWNRVLINDEAVVKKHAGLCSPVKNLFGFVTGFLLKDAQWLYNRWYPGIESKIEHVAANPIELFNDYAVIFQKHAFGKDFDYFIKVRNSLERSIYTDDIKAVMADLVNFWTAIYEQFSRSGSNEVIATQDLVFSIDYAKALLDNSVTIKKVFLGPDITYPIEILAFQKQRATANAQKFVQQFVNRIEPINNENTAYFFCSYVDGVGKSTLLNNIKNYQLHGFDLDSYARCDNSSSQFAEIYGLKPGVFLVDMPAQMSHFVAKPDGYVFAEVDTVKDLKPGFCDRAIKHAYKNAKSLTNAFLALKKSLEAQDLTLFQPNSPIEHYAYNFVLLNPGANSNKDFANQRLKWIPYEFEQHFLLFNINDRKSLRVLTPIAETHSKGLKEVIPEMMLFTKGVSFPKPYDDFLTDLNQKLADAHIKKVVFVDFLSMYPRSSRENVRLNFIMQYLTKLFNSHKGTFDIENTMYQHQVYPEQEIFHKLSNAFDKMRDNFVFETALRWALFELTNSTTSLSIDSPVALEAALNDIIYKFIDEHGFVIQDMATKKLENEKQLYSDKYLLDKIYENIVKFKFEPLLNFSDMLIKLMKTGIENETLNVLWGNLDSEIKEVDNQTQIARLYSGEKLEIKYKVHIDSKEQDSVNEIIRVLRAQWFAVLENILKGVLVDQKIEIAEISQNVPPLILKRLGDSVYILQKRLPLLDSSNKNEPKTKRPKAPIKYHLMDSEGKKKRWSQIDDQLYCLDWENIGTFFGIFAYGYFPFNLSKDAVTKTVEKYKLLRVKSDQQDWGITITDLYNQSIGDKDIRQFKKDGLKKDNVTVLKESDPTVFAVRLWVRMIATLDMIAKDFSSEILIRKGNTDDFIATLKMLEITLAKYYSLDFDFNLFDDYTAVSPVISWDSINAK